MLEEADQIACSDRQSGGLGSQRLGGVLAHDTVSGAAQPGLFGRTSNRPWGINLLGGHRQRSDFLQHSQPLLDSNDSCISPEQFELLLFG